LIYQNISNDLTLSLTEDSLLTTAWFNFDCGSYLYEPDKRQFYVWSCPWPFSWKSGNQKGQAIVFFPLHWTFFGQCKNSNWMRIVDPAVVFVQCTEHVHDDELYFFYYTRCTAFHAAQVDCWDDENCVFCCCCCLRNRRLLCYCIISRDELYWDDDENESTTIPLFEIFAPLKFSGCPGRRWLPMYRFRVTNPDE